MLYAFDANNYSIDQDEYIGEKIFKLVDKKNIKLKGIIGTSKFLLVEACLSMSLYMLMDPLL